MKTARERALDLWADLPNRVAALMDREGWITRVERMFKEAMRDQRHVCADAVNAVDAAHDAHAACMNAPFPGERVKPVTKHEPHPAAWRAEKDGEIRFIQPRVWLYAEYYRQHGWTVTPLYEPPPSCMRR